MPFELLSLQFVLPKFLMVMFRITGLALSSPLLGSRAAPAPLKVGFAMVLSMMIFPVVAPLTPATLELPQLVGCVAGELIVGLSVGMASELVFLGARLAGVVVGQQSGIALGQVVNPMLDGESTIVSQIYYLVAMMVFLAVGGHRIMIGALLDSYHTIPPGSYGFDGSFMDLIGHLLASAFQLGLRLAAPAVVALFMASLTMGFVARTIPQLNILTIGFAVRVFVGLSVAGLSISLSYDLLYDNIVDVMGRLDTALGIG